MEEFELKALLCKHIEKFTEEACCLDAWSIVGLVSNIEKNMTEAAFSVLMANKDLNDYLAQENLLKD